MEYQQLMTEKAQLLKALAHPIRLCLVKKLCEQGRLNVTYFTNCMDASQSSISQHLGKLRDLGILACEKEGQSVIYHIKNETVRAVVKSLFEEEENE